MKPWPSELPPLPVATPDDRPVALLLRHAERPSIAPGEHGTDLSLTASGRTCAELLGVTLGGRILSISTSPVRRCRETAEALRLGANIEVDIVDDHLLGDPGVFVLDPELAWTHWKTMGHEAVVEHIAYEDPPLPGLAPAHLATLRLAQHMNLALRGSPAGLHIFVTHDAILFPLATRLLRSPHRHGWPAFLEAAALWEGTNTPILSYRRCSHAIYNEAVWS